MSVEWHQHNIHLSNLSVDAERCCFSQCLQVSKSSVVSFEVQAQFKIKKLSVFVSLKAPTSMHDGSLREHQQLISYMVHVDHTVH